MNLNKRVERLGRGVDSAEIYQIGKEKLGFDMMRVTEDGTVFYISEARVLRVTATETQIMPFATYKKEYCK